MKFIKVRVDLAFNVIMKLPDDISPTDILKEFPGASQQLFDQYHTVINDDPNLELIDMKMGMPEFGEV